MNMLFCFKSISKTVTFKTDEPRVTRGSLYSREPEKNRSRSVYFPKCQNVLSGEKKSWKAVTVIHEHKLDLHMCFLRIRERMSVEEHVDRFYVCHPVGSCLLRCGSFIQRLLVKIRRDVLLIPSRKGKKITSMFCLTVNLPLLPWILRLLTSLSRLFCRWWLRTVT